MNQYTITNIDPILNIVYVTFVYNTHTLNETLFVPDVTDAIGITSLLDKAYAAFTMQMDALDVRSQLTVTISSLIGLVRTQDQVNQALGITPAPLPPQSAPPS